MKIIDSKNKIRKSELQKMTSKMFEGLVKAVIDVKKKIMIVDAPMHADQEAELLKMGSKQENLWGINLYPDEKDENLIEFDSIINIRPNQGNRSREVDNPKIREEIIKIVNKLVEK